MDSTFSKFERIVRKSYQFTYVSSSDKLALHPFEARDIHQSLPDIVRKLFDNGHYSQATFEAFKFIDKEIQRLSSLKQSGSKLMMRVFAESSPLIALTENLNPSEKDEQEGYKFLFAGSVLAIRNPRAHEHSLKDSPDVCLDHLGLASLLLRRLETAGYSIKKT